jgi:hypothetical protein
MTGLDTLTAYARVVWVAAALTAGLASLSAACAPRWQVAGV